MVIAFDPELSILMVSYSKLHVYVDDWRFDCIPFSLTRLGQLLPIAFTLLGTQLNGQILYAMKSQSEKKEDQISNEL